jgi:hypothetical protein
METVAEKSSWKANPCRLNQGKDLSAIEVILEKRKTEKGFNLVAGEELAEAYKFPSLQPRCSAEADTR